MNPEELTTLVEKDVRGEATPEQIALLEANVREWIAELNVLLRDVEIQFNSHKAALYEKQADFLSRDDRSGWLKAKAEEERWRTGSNRFRASVEKRIMHAKNVRAAQHDLKHSNSGVA